MTTTTPTDLWEAREVLAHIRDFARARRVGPIAMLGSILLRANASVDPNVVLPPVIGGVASLNMAIAMVGPSGHGKGATEAAARAATNLPAIVELPVGSGEGLARTFAANSEGHQEVRSAIFTATEVDGLAAIGGRSGATLMAVLRQLYSGEAIGSANAQKHTRVIVDAHTYRAMISVGVQPERAAPLFADTAGTVQRFLWVPVGDHDAPDLRPVEPERWSVPRTLVSAGRQTVLTLPLVARQTMEEHHLAKLRGEPIDPLDGHKLLTRAKVAAAMMILHGRMHEISVEDWELAGAMIRVSDTTRSHIERTLQEQARKASRARAHAAADQNELIAERKLQRAKAGVLRLLERHGDLPTRDLRSKLKADIRDDLGAALDELVAEGAVLADIVERGVRYRLPQVQRGTAWYSVSDLQEHPKSEVQRRDAVPTKPLVRDAVPKNDAVPPVAPENGQLPPSDPREGSVRNSDERVDSDSSHCAACRTEMSVLLAMSDLCPVCSAALRYVDRVLDKAEVASKTDLLKACSSTDGSRAALNGVLDYAITSGRVEAVAFGGRTKYARPEQQSNVHTPGRHTGQWLASGHESPIETTRRRTP